VKRQEPDLLHTAVPVTHTHQVICTAQRGCSSAAHAVSVLNACILLFQ
jgi:hypothetical protein